MNRSTLPILMLSAALAATAIPAFSATKTGAVNVYGRDYQTVTREFKQSGRTVLTGEVRVRNFSYACNPLQTGSCETAVKKVLASSQPRTVEGVPVTSGRQIIGTR